MQILLLHIFVSSDVVTNMGSLNISYSYGVCRRRDRDALIYALIHALVSYLYLVFFCDYHHGESHSFCFCGYNTTL
jgi:hypothetical protein